MWAVGTAAICYFALHALTAPVHLALVAARWLLQSILSAVFRDITVPPVPVGEYIRRASLTLTLAMVWLLRRFLPWTIEAFYRAGMRCGSDPARVASLLERMDDALPWPAMCSFAIAVKRWAVYNATMLLICTIAAVPHTVLRGCLLAVVIFRVVRLPFGPLPGFLAGTAALVPHLVAPCTALLYCWFDARTLGRELAHPYLPSRFRARDAYGRAEFFRQQDITLVGTVVPFSLLLGYLPGGAGVVLLPVAQAVVGLLVVERIDRTKLRVVESAEFRELSRAV